MSKIKALILDAGGVLVRPLHGNWNIPVKYRELLGGHANDIPGESWLDACRCEAAILREDVYISGMEEEYRLRREFLCRVAARMNWQLEEEALRKLAHDFTWNINRYVWYGDVETWLPRWHESYRVGILSDSMPSFRHVVESHAANAHIDNLVVSTEIGVGKPDAKMYLTACENLGAAPADCLFVDDREGNLIGAMKAGMRAVQMCRDGLPEWNGPAVHDLAELNAYLEGLN